MWQLIAILIIAALWVKYFWLFVLGVAAIWLVWFCRKEWKRNHAEAKAAAVAERERIEGLIARADQQQAWRMQGDPRGIYGGEFPAAPS
jgi:hypothetical protein